MFAILPLILRFQGQGLTGRKKEPKKKKNESKYANAGTASVLV